MIKRLFCAIADDPELCSHLTLHYGAWRLLDPEFLELYRRAFNCGSDRPMIEFSPETASDPIRAVIKRGSTYSLEEMEENFREISEAFQGLPAHICFDHLSTDVGSRYWGARKRPFA